MSPDLVRRGVPGAALSARLARRARGEHAVDEWGLDPELVGLGDPLFGLRWDIRVEGAERLPAVGGAVVVWNRRSGLSEPWVLGRGIRRAAGRYVRVVGAPDVAPVGPLVRRLGAVLDRPDEIRGLLRAGHLVGVPAARQVRGRDRVGAVDPDRLRPALEVGVPVHPVALLGREVGRAWQVVVGPPVSVPDEGPGRAERLSEATRTAVHALLDDALPAPRWLS